MGIWLLEYKNYLRSEKGASAHTIRAYEADLNLWLRYLKPKAITPDSANIKIFRNFLKKFNKLNRSSVERKIYAIKNYYEFLLKKNFISSNPLREFTVKSQPKKIPKILNEEQAFQLVDKTIKERDHLIILVLYGCGLRVSEVSNLKWSEINFAKHEIIIKNAKGRKDRIVPLIDEVFIKLKKFKHNQQYVFNNYLNQRLSTRSILNIVKKQANENHLNQKTTPHSLRHSFASHLLQNGANLREIQELLGHSSLSTTQKYLHLDLKQIMTDYDNAHPLAKNKK